MYLSFTDLFCSFCLVWYLDSIFSFMQKWAYFWQQENPLLLIAELCTSFVLSLLSFILHHIVVPKHIFLHSLSWCCYVSVGTLFFLLIDVRFVALVSLRKLQNSDLLTGWMPSWCSDCFAVNESFLCVTVFLKVLINMLICELKFSA